MTLKKTLVVRSCLFLTLLLASNYHFVLAQWTKLWQQAGYASTEPTGRYGNIMVLVNDNIYIFGGIDAKNNTLDDTWTYPLGSSEGSSWIKIGNETSIRPSPRTGACASVVYQQDEATGESYAEIYVFGGLGRNETHHILYHDMWRLTITSKSSVTKLFWTQIFPPDSNSVLPIARYEASLVLYEKKLYLYGGFQDEQQLTDLLVYDLSTNQWKNLDSTMTRPSPSLGSGHSAALVEFEQVGTQMVIFDTVTFWVYSFEKNEWQMTSLEQMGIDVSMDRKAVQIVANKDKIFFFGGTYQVKITGSKKTPSYYVTEYSNMMVCAIFASTERGLLLESNYEEEQANPTPRADVKMVLWQDKLIIFGGSIEQKTASAIGQMWQFNLLHADWFNPFLRTSTFAFILLGIILGYLFLGFVVVVIEAFNFHRSINYEPYMSEKKFIAILWLLYPISVPIIFLCVFFGSFYQKKTMVFPNN